MGMLICDICNEQISFDPSIIHACDHEKIKAHVNKLKDAARLAEANLDKIQNNVFMVLHFLPSLEGETITIDTDWIRKLWSAANCRWWEAQTADSFLSRWMVTHRILCEAFDLFRTRANGKLDQSVLARLKDLKKACDNARDFLYPTTGPFDLTPEQVLEKGSKS